MSMNTINEDVCERSSQTNTYQILVIRGHMMSKMMSYAHFQSWYKAEGGLRGLRTGGDRAMGRIYH